MVAASAVERLLGGHCRHRPGPWVDLKVPGGHAVRTREKKQCQKINENYKQKIYEPSISQGSCGKCMQRQRRVCLYFSPPAAIFITFSVCILIILHGCLVILITACKCLVNLFCSPFHYCMFFFSFFAGGNRAHWLCSISLLPVVCWQPAVVFTLYSG